MTSLYWSIGGMSRCQYNSWWRHQMETFSASLAICAGNSPVHGEFPAQRPVTRSFDVSFDLRLNKRLSKQPWGWWFETPAWSLWRHRNVDFNESYRPTSAHTGNYTGYRVICLLPNSLPQQWPSLWRSICWDDFFTNKVAICSNCFYSSDLFWVFCYFVLNLK